MKRLLAAALAGLGLSAPPVQAAIWHVDASVAHPGDGRTWAGAFRHLQDALTNRDLGAGDEIRVAAGVYRCDEFAGSPGSLGPGYSFELPANVGVYGGFPPGGGPASARDPVAHESVMTGSAWQPQHTFEACGAPGVGAGDCFSETSGVAGCATTSCCETVCALMPFCCLAGWDDQCVEVAFDACGIGAPVVQAPGLGTIIRLDGFTIRGGHLDGADSGYPSAGAGMRIAYAGGPVVVANCRFVDNVAPHGGALEVNRGTARLFNCTFEANHASKGGAVYVREGTAVMMNCLFAGNVAGSVGSAVYADAWADASLVNCTLVDNVSGSHGVAAYNVSRISNSILWGNGGHAIYGAGTVAHSCVEGGHAGEGNIGEAPGFLDPAEGNYRIALGSPALDAGSGLDLCLDAADLDGDRDDQEVTPLDLDRSPRVLGGAVDMGVYERCPYDLDGDGGVSVVDIFGLFDAWGSPSDGPPDFDGSGVVGIADFFALLGHWGGCG